MISKMLFGRIYRKTVFEFFYSFFQNIFPL